MYNHEIKERYLSEKPEKTAINIRNLFEFSAKLEERVNCDAAEFSVGQISEMMEEVGFAEPHTICDRIGKFSSYGAWYRILHPTIEPQYTDYCGFYYGYSFCLDGTDSI